MKRSKKRFRRSISTTLLLSFSALILTVTVATVLNSYKYTRDQLEKNATDYTAQLVSQVTAELNMYVDYIKDTFDFISTSSAVTNYLDTQSSSLREAQYSRVVQTLQNAANIRTEISTIALASTDGRVLFGNFRDRLNKFSDYQNADWYRLALEQPGQVLISSSRIENLVSGRYSWVVSFSQAIGNQAVLLIDLRYDVIDEICANIQLGNRGYIFLVDQAGDILWHPQQNLINAKLKAEDVSEILTDPDGLVLRDTAEGQKLYVTSPSTSTGWTAVGVAYVEELLEDEERMITQYLAIGALAVALAFLLSLALSRAVTTPVRKLTDTMLEVEGGDFSVRCDVRSRSELGMLSESFNHMISNTETLMAAQLRNEEQKRLNEWRLLQAQIKPHFLYNTLDSIIWMSHAGKNEQVVEMTSALAQLLRNSIGSGKELIPLGEELAHVESYLAIQTMRYNEKLCYTMDIDPKTRDCAIPKLSLQPLVENAIYHGIKIKEDGGHIHIAAMLDEDRLLITVEDDGAGMTEEQLAHIHEQKESDESSSKIGVYNVNERLRIYFGEDFGLKFFSEPDKGTTAMLVLPIHIYQEEDTNEATP